MRDLLDAQTTRYTCVSVSEINIVGLQCSVVMEFCWSLYCTGVGVHGAGVSTVLVQALVHACWRSAGVGVIVVFLL